MEKIIIQVYEIQTPQEAKAMIALGVDRVGTVLLEKQSWKSASIRNTIDAVHERGVLSSLIPLFNEQDTVLEALDFYRPTIVHFCETLVAPKNPERMGYNRAFINRLTALQATIRQRFPGIKIMRSIPIAPSGSADKVPSLELAGIFELFSDLFLTDTLLLSDFQNPEQPVPGFVGITGKTCDWSVASELVESSKLPVILAGGISPENVYEAIVNVRPAGVDSCTLTNARDNHGKPVRFKKDLYKVEKMIKEVRKAEKVIFL